MHLLSACAFGLALLTLPATAHAAADDWQVAVDCTSGTAIITVTNLSDTDGGIRVEGGLTVDVGAGKSAASPASDTGIVLPGEVEFGTGDGQLTVIGGFPGVEQLDFLSVDDCPAVVPPSDPAPTTIVVPARLPATGGGSDLTALAAVAVFGGIGVVLAARRT